MGATPCFNLVQCVIVGYHTRVTIPVAAAALEPAADAKHSMCSHGTTSVPEARHALEPRMALVSVLISIAKTLRDTQSQRLNKQHI